MENKNNLRISYPRSNGFSKRTLLSEAKLSDAEPGMQRELLESYQQVLNLLLAETEKSIALQNMISTLYHSGKTGTSEYKKYENELIRCNKTHDALDNQVTELSKNEMLESLYNKLYAKAKEEKKQQMEQSMKEYRQQIDDRFEEGLKKLRLEMEEKKRKAAAQELVAVEKEIDQVRLQIKQINEDLTHLKFAWFGEKYHQKKQLEKMQTDLFIRLTQLYNRKSQLNSNF